MYKILTLEFKNKIVFESVQIDDEFVPMGEYREFEKEDLDFMRSFKERYFLNIKKGKGSITEIVYEFSSKTDDFEEIFSVLLPYQSKIDLNMYIETEYEPLDYDNADAYFVAFSDGCDYYDDEKYNSLEILCTEEDCCVRGHKETMYIEPTRKQVKEFSKKFIGATTEDGVNVISLPLKAFLEEKGVSANLFKPVYQKRAQFGHIIFSEKSIFYRPYLF